MSICISFAINNKNISIYKSRSLVKVEMIKNCYVCDVKYITTYTKTTTNDSLLSYEPSSLYSFLVFAIVPYFG